MATQPADQPAWGTPVEIERRNRIFLSIAAYAYEFEAFSLVSDEAFDEAAFQIKPEMSTGNPVLDEFFRTEFSPSTGMWIRKHPYLTQVARRYQTIRSYLDDHQ